MSTRGNPNATELHDETVGLQVRLEKDIAAIEQLLEGMPAEDQLYVAELVAFLEKFGVADYPVHGAQALSLVARRLELAALERDRERHATPANLHAPSGVTASGALVFAGGEP